MCIRDRNFLDELRVEINSKSFWTSKGSGRMTEMCIRDRPGAGRLRGEVSVSEALNLSPSKRLP